MDSGYKLPESTRILFRKQQSTCQAISSILFLNHFSWQSIFKIPWKEWKKITITSWRKRGLFISFLWPWAHFSCTVFTSKPSPWLVLCHFSLPCLRHVEHCHLETQVHCFKCWWMCKGVLIIVSMSPGFKLQSSSFQVGYIFSSKLAPLHSLHIS